MTDLPVYLPDGSILVPQLVSHGCTLGENGPSTLLAFTMTMIPVFDRGT